MSLSLLLELLLAATSLHLIHLSMALQGPKILWVCELGTGLCLLPWLSSLETE